MGAGRGHRTGADRVSELVREDRVGGVVGGTVSVEGVGVVVECRGG